MYFHAVLRGFHGSLSPRHQSCALDDAFDLLPNLFEYRSSCSAQIKLRRSVFRDNVRRITAMRNDAVNAHIGREVLAKRIDAVIDLNQCVKRIDALLGRTRGVRGLAMKFNVYRRTA